jgi:putative ABC transport system permease protein
MLKNYVKIAWKVLLRRKFFTAISLFGISFTLLVLMLSVASVKYMLDPAMPGSKLARTIFAARIEYKSEGNHIISTPSYDFLDKNVRTLTRPERVSILSNNKTTVCYVNNRKLTLDVKYTDANFWYILECPFLEGRPYDSAAVAGGAKVAVISEKMRRNYFGDVSAVDKEIEIGADRFRVVGVIDNREIPFYYAFADIYFPLTTAKGDPFSGTYWGNYMALVLAARKADWGAIQAELKAKTAEIIRQNPDITKLDCIMGSPLDEMAHLFFEDNPARGKVLLISIGILMALLFMLLPTVNLVNLNLSRIIERFSEIGVRKAFGASSMTLVGQFIIENVILTLIGGAIGLILAAIVLEIVSHSGLIPYGHFTLNFMVFFYSIIICLFFGLFSGVYPAFKMSRLHPVEALRGGRL